MTFSNQHHGDYSDPFNPFPNPHSDNDFLDGNERKSDFLRTKSQNSGRYSVASSKPPFSEQDDHEYNEGPSQLADSQATLADNASGFGRSGKYEDLG